MDTEFIPIVDLEGFGVGQELKDERKEKEIAQKIHQAFSNIGFVYLINHGIPDQQINVARELADKFFILSEETKSNYKRQPREFHGWIAMEDEKLNVERPLADYKEAFNITPHHMKNWPNKVVDGFQEVMENLIKSSQQLAHIVLRMMALGLNLQDENMFVKHHKFERVENVSTLRCLNYPPVPDSLDINSGQARCGEHSDFGSITLLFQDGVKGLEVMNRDGIYQAARPIPGAVIVNISDLMQRWTADVLVSTKHRVLITEDEAARKAHRRSIAYFVQPDDDCLVECIDGSNKYPPITSLNYLHSRYDVIY